VRVAITILSFTSIWLRLTPLVVRHDTNRERSHRVDSATLYVNLDGNNGNVPTPNAFRFDAQANCRSTRPVSGGLRGNGSDWATASISFTTTSGYKGSWNDIRMPKGGL